MAGEGLNKGWISVHRNIQDNWLWQEKPFSKGQAWIDLLLSANHQDRKTLLGNELIIVNRGSFITSQKKLMNRWGWGSEKTRTFLKLLEEDGMIKFAPDKKKTTIEILNYDIYQIQNDTKPVVSRYGEEVQNANGTQTECDQNVSRTSAETNNNDNNYNNLNNDNKYIYDTSNEAMELCKYYSSIKQGQSITQYLPTLKIWITDHGYEWTKEAIEKCVKNKKRFIQPYIEALLKDWQKNGKEEQSGHARDNNPENEGKYAGFKPAPPKVADDIDTTGLI